jgi:cardiolipin synthase
MSKFGTFLKTKKWYVLGIVIASILVTIIALNFTSGEKKIDKRISELYPVSSPQFTRAMGNLLGPPLVSGNRVQALYNGDQIFPSMLEAIHAARHSIDFETYIYWSGDIGKKFADALAERARAGVKVHLLADWVGSEKMDAAMQKAMEDSGVQIRKYHPLSWYNLARVNHRTHRKLLVVDGRVGFTGGVGIADNWLGHAQDENHWRDSHFKIEGPAVAHMQAAFMDNWMKTTGEVLHGDDYFPALEMVGGQSAQVFRSSPAEGAESMRLMYLMSVAAARKHIYIANAYFVPDDLALTMLTRALKRGVKISIMMPGKHTDAASVRGASRARWGTLLEAGADLYEYEPTMYHCKVMVVDGLWTSVGSTNFDSRSFRLNDEANLNVYDAAFAEQQITTFEQDVKLARRISYEEWKNRPWTEKVLEHGAALFRSQL